MGGSPWERGTPLVDAVVVSMAYLGFPTIFLQPHSAGLRQASFIYSGGGWRPGCLPYTLARASDRLVEVLLTLLVFWGFWGRLSYTPLGHCLFASWFVVRCGRRQDLLLAWPLLCHAPQAGAAINTL